MSEGATRAANLSPEEKRELLARLLRRRAGGQKTAPASFSQQRLWFIDQLEPGSAAYNIPSGVKLTGPLDTSALAESLNDIARRHETLRTTFATSGGEPVQVIHPHLPLDVPCLDLTRLPAAEREEEARRLAAEEAQRPFDLARGPLWRASLVKLSPEEHVLLLTMHHIVSDGWSTGVLVEELAELYAARREGREASLPGLAVQYADYARWQHQHLAGEELERQLGYWREQLAGAPAVLELPTDRPRPPVQTFRGGSARLTIPARPYRALGELCEREEVTLFMALLAAFKTLLYRHTGQTDIVVGTPSAGRTRAEIERLIGFFINTLVLRTRLSGNPTFRELLGRVREVALGAYAYQDLPFEKLVEELHPERDLSRTPLVQVMFNLLKFAGQRIELPRLTVESLAPPEAGAKFDLTLYARELGDELELEFVYNADLFEHSTIEAMLARLGTLLEGAVANPEERLKRLPLLGHAERQRLAAAANTVRPSNPFVGFGAEEVEQSIARRFARQAAAHPSRVAVKTKSAEWTYAALDRFSDRVARAVLGLRGGGEERVALLFEHGDLMIAGILGALKAGKTYVPLDCSYPLPRISHMLEDSGAVAVVTNRRNLGLARELAAGSLPVVNVEDLGGVDDGPPPALEVPPDRPAYILYTSGSTGRPKGVVQSHRNVLRHIRNYTNNLHLCADDRLLLVASYSFDAAVMDIYGALLNGASLFAYDIKEEGFDGLAADLAAEGVTVYHSTPTVYRYFLNTLPAAAGFPRLRLVVLGGEEVFKRDFELFRRHFAPGCIFVNGLGPTESTVTLQYFLDHGSELRRNSVPVGYAVEGTEVLLLDEDGEAVEGCGVGEIAVRSAHLALGYWRQPGLTQAVFLPDRDDAATRVYRTGDVGRLLPDGSLEFIGRKDFQVKIRGQRVEVGEIETALLAHAGVREAVVLAVASGASDRRLAAYVVPAPAAAPAPAELRAHLKSKLPDYMVPSTFDLLDALPLTPNGKVDRRALPAPSAEGLARDGDSEGPATPVEELLAGIWAEVLGVERVGRSDNFFELGGHSLLATQIVSRVRRAFSAELPLRRLFESPTVAALAEAVERELRAGARAELPPVSPAPRDEPLPLSYAQQRLWFINQLEPGNAAYNIPSAVRLAGELNAAALEGALTEVARRHETLRTSFPAEGGRPVQVISPPAPVTLDTVDLSQLPAAEREE
ncbi:MAG TPA: amino acid adenylation domain-containing protein, partial [Pyrinomonadaceae bacterium]|nr:amino acid adenylation domain-containing protein [Pyrinomonadaceae bacterium]